MSATAWSPRKAKQIAWVIIIGTAMTIGLYGSLIFFTLTSDAQQPAHYIDGWTRFGAVLVFSIPLLMQVLIWQLMMLAYRVATRVPETPTEGE